MDKYIHRNYRVHILDIAKTVTMFEDHAGYLVSSYLISINEVNALFDYCMHKAIANIFNTSVALNGVIVSSNYVDVDLYESIYIDIGEWFIGELYNNMLSSGLVDDLRNGHTYGNIKLTVAGTTLWLFLNIERKNDVYKDTFDR